MTLRTKFEGCLLALCLSASLAASSFAQSPSPSNRPPQPSPPHSAPLPAQRPDSGNRPPQRSAPPPASRPAPQGGPGTGQSTGGAHQPASRDDRPPASSGNSKSSARDAGHPNVDPNRPPVNRQTSDPNRPPESQYSRGGQNSYNSYRNNQQRLSPEDRQRVLQNQQRFRQLTPQQQQDMRDRQHVWQQMTQQQRDHIKYEVLPNWRTLPPQRKKAIEQRLGVLQNMPEFARNQHLNDPNFTRGMSAEDRAMLRDLSHLHVGGVPDPPTNNPR
jgi:Protein of unknown function (DUF3106)